MQKPAHKFIKSALILLFSVQSFVIGSFTSFANFSDYENLRPSQTEEDGFSSLQEINPDVFGWLEIFGTNINYPMVQGTNNQRYLDFNARGEPSLTGAIFMDYRNDANLSNFNHIIYGHDMARDIMFGAIGSFEDETFFNDRQFGMIYNGERHYGIEFFAFMLVDAFDQAIYHPTMTHDNDKLTLLERIENDAIQFRDIDVSIDDRLVILSTCTPTVTNGRHILVGRLTDEVQDNPFLVSHPSVEGGQLYSSGMGSLTPSVNLVIFGAFVFSTSLLVYRVIKRFLLKNRKKEGKVENTKKRKYKHSFIMDLFLLTLRLGVLGGSVVVIFTFVLGATQVADASMFPSLREGDIVFFTRHGFDNIRRDDLVVIRFDGIDQVRRVVATAGDVVDITYFGLEVNGNLVDEPRIMDETTQFADIGVSFPVEVNEGEIFILGDARVRATDSRVYGTVSLENTLGRAFTFLRRRNF